MTNHWDTYDQSFSRLGAPQRPPPEAVRQFKHTLNPAGKLVLLLGVTPELRDLSDHMVAVDSSPGMIAGVWPGNDENRVALLGDWLDLPIDGASMDRVAGDGCLSAVDTREARCDLLAEMARVMKPDGTAAVRLFAGPEEFEDLEEIRQAALARSIESFHALKWHVAMACTTRDADRCIPVQKILHMIDDLFADREALSSATGWSRDSIDTIDLYRGSDMAYSFATADMLVEEASRSFEDVSLVATGDYPLSERCPLLVLRQPKTG